MGNGSQGARWNRWDLAAVGALLAVTTAFVARFWGFTLDDAFITWRYGKNLAAGHGLTWNPGLDPVEGYTSFLWAVLSALPHLLGADVVATMKLLSLAGLVASVVTLYAWGRHRGITRWILVPAVGFLALNPGFVFLSTQGMETGLALGLVTGASVLALSYTQSPTPRKRHAMALLLLGAMFARPDLAVFSLGLAVGLLGVTAGRDQGEATRLFGTLALWDAIPGIVFLLARKAYFGHWLPNPFYVKASGFSLVVPGVRYVAEFLFVVLGPLILVGGLALLLRRRDAKLVLRPLVPLALGLVPFLALWFVVEPRQAFLWRFQAPVAGVVILTVLHLVDGVDAFEGPFEALERSWRDRVRPAARSFGAVALALALVAFPLHTYDDASQQLALRDQGDRVAIGETLARFDPSTHRLFTTESGAPAYYSGWITVDEWGLNNETIAHEGLTPELIERFDPQVVLVLLRIDQSVAEKSAPTAAFLDQGGYELVTVTQRTGSTDLFHLLYVNTDASDADAIACALATMPGVEHVTDPPFQERDGVDAPRATIDEGACPGA